MDRPGDLELPRPGDDTPSAEPAVIVFAADDGYCLPLAVAMTSAARNYRGPAPLQIFVLDAGILPEHRDRLSALLARLGVAIRWVPVDLGSLRQLPVHDHITTTTYARLLVPSHLPAAITKAIYLDCDILVEADVGRLWCEAMGDDEYILGVQGHGTKRLIATSPLARIPEVAAGPDEPYFNAGVLVMNLRAMRRDDVPERAFAFCRRWLTVVRNADQDILNAMSIRRWRPVAPTWNLFLAQGGGKYVFRYQPGSILHFTSSSKPWNPRSIRYPQSADTRRAFRQYRKYMWESGWFSAPASLRQRIDYQAWKFARFGQRAAQPLLRPFKSAPAAP